MDYKEKENFLFFFHHFFSKKNGQKKHKKKIRCISPFKNLPLADDAIFFDFGVSLNGTIGLLKVVVELLCNEFTSLSSSEESDFS